MEVSIDTSQIQVLEDFFEGLSNLDQRRIFLASFRKAARPLVSAAKSNSPVNTGNLSRSFGTLAVPGEIAIIVGAKKGGGYKGWHAHLVENGTVARFRKTKGNAPTGRIRGTHFFEEAFNQTQQEMYSTIEQDWLEEIDKFIIKTNRRIK